MIGVDWGTSSFRAFRLAPDGAIRDRRSGPRGILTVPDGRFAETLREEIGPWLATGEDRVLLAGMIGSRQGWREAPYLPCPAGPADIAAALLDVPFDWAQVRMVPGLIAADPTGVPEVLRGEETQIAGLLAHLGAGGLICLPGTHSKWVSVAEGKVISFVTHMTGEIFATLRGHTILGRTMHDGAHDPTAFAAGLARASEAGGLLHHLFGVRSLALTDRLAATAGASYLSGLLIGHEVNAALAGPNSRPSGATVHVAGAPDLVAHYAQAIAAVGGEPIRHDADVAAAGLHLIGNLADWA